MCIRDRSNIVQSLNAVGVSPSVQSDLLRDITSLLNEANGADVYKRQAVCCVDNVQLLT